VKERPAAEKAAGLLRKAGAREALIAQWVAEGERRVERASLPPFGMRLLGSDEKSRARPLPCLPLIGAGPAGPCFIAAGRQGPAFRAAGARRHCRPKTGAGHPIPERLP
jgi:hypothetical protein